MAGADVDALSNRGIAQPQHGAERKREKQGKRNRERGRRRDQGESRHSAVCARARACLIGS